MAPDAANPRRVIRRGKHDVNEGDRETRFTVKWRKTTSTGHKLKVEN